VIKNTFRPMKSIVAAAAVVGVLALGGSLPAFAAADTGVAVTGGSLSGGAITFNDFGGITLDGTDQTTTATWSIANVIDARGSGAGWNVSLALTQLAEYDAVGTSYVASGKKLATGSITVTTAPVVTAVSGSAASTVTPVTANTALDTGSAVTLLSAAVNGGMGEYSFSDLTATLAIPANAYAKTYKSDATVSTNLVP
jgi:hypothetical protein